MISIFAYLGSIFSFQWEMIFILFSIDTVNHGVKCFFSSHSPGCANNRAPFTQHIAFLWLQWLFWSQASDPNCSTEFYTRSSMKNLHLLELLRCLTMSLELWGEPTWLNEGNTKKAEPWDRNRALTTLLEHLEPACMLCYFFTF